MQKLCKEKKSKKSLYLFISLLASASLVLDASLSVAKRGKTTSSNKKGLRSASSKKSTSSSKKGLRSASSKKSTSSSKKGLRSASSQSATSTRSSKRSSATSSRGNARRMSAVKSSTSLANSVSNESSSTTKTSTSGKVCPVGRVIAFKADEDQYYYAKKKTCSIPENSEEQPWDSSSELKKASWIDAGEAVVFQCEDGYIEKKNACVDGYEICPLNEPLEKAGKSSYLNPNTDDACSVPTNATPRKASQEIMEDYGLDSGSAYILGCKEGYYSAQLKGMSDDYIAQCNKCPEGTTSPYGSTSESACVLDDSVVSTSESESTEIASTPVQAVAPVQTPTPVAPVQTPAPVASVQTPAPVSAPAPTVTCQPGTYKANSTTCTPCPAGKYSSSTDATSCSACPTGQWAVAGSKSCTSCLTTGVATCDATTGKVLSCQTGYNLLNDACSKPAVTAASCVA
ncbi:MAG: hypothetical protein IKP65_07215, partial [Alphaproteobacteria bacterium]|nr:hypothetical protein [Alphaproteobacteria bacterium]